MTKNETSADAQSVTSPKVVSAGVVLVIAILGLIYALTGQRVPSPAPPGASAPVTPSASGSEPSTCGLAAVELNGTVAEAPTSATWTLVGTTAAPSIQGQGPGEITNDGYRSCYAHTATGALVAAANYTAIGSDRSLTEKFHKKAFVPGPGQEALLSRPNPSARPTAVRIQIAGFRVLRYTGSQADIDVAVRATTGVVGAQVLNLQWSGGDWKIRLADDGSALIPFSQLPSLDGFIPWAGA